MKPWLFLLALLGACLPETTQAQPPSPTDIYLVSFADLDGSGPVSLIQLTKRAGYDNQPYFTPDSKHLLYTAIMDDFQADIFRIDLETRKEERVTKTKESEFSPTPLPDGSGFSVVRVESDTTQRLWRFPYGKGEPRLILEKVRGVGYHAWADTNKLLLFMLGDPYLLVLANTDTGDTSVVAENIGRSLLTIPLSPQSSAPNSKERDVSFLHIEGSFRTIKSIDPASHRVTSLAPAPEGSEDFAWTPDHRLLTAQGLVLSEWNPREKHWETLAVLGSQVPGKITRLAVSPDGKWLALVAEEKPTPQSSQSSDH